MRSEAMLRTTVLLHSATAAFASGYGSSPSFPPPAPPPFPPDLYVCPEYCAAPHETCFYDPTCLNGGLGCNAGNKGQACRFCGFGEFDKCPCEGGSCDDPITTFQGVETRYWLSMEHFTPVFEQGPLALSQLAGPANPPPGLENHKGAWVTATELKIADLDSILVEAVDPTTLLAQPNATAPPASDALTTMRLSFAGKQLKAGEHKLSVSDMAIAVSAKADPDQKIGRGFVERIDITAEGLHLRITSSKANKFADETVQVLGLHLDVQFLAFEQDKVRGALPEMWGLQPMSKETKLLLEKPAGF